MSEKARKLRDAIRRKEILLIPGGFSPLHARLCERLGFEAFFMSGSQVAAYLFALPDVGLLSMRDMVDAVRRLAAGSEIPVLADADTGFGNAINVRHTVQEYIQAGAAGLHIEDQEFPKRSGTKSGRRCISLQEAAGKYRAAVDAARELDPDFVICARCDLIGAEGWTFEEAIERCLAYGEAGADLIWLNSIPSLDMAKEALERIPHPVMPSYAGAGPSGSFQDWQEWGAAALVFPALTTSAGLQATWELLSDFKERGRAAQAEASSRARSSHAGPIAFNELTDEKGVPDLEARYLPAEQQRDYGNTFGSANVP
jgi:2-methylisocitrate lyase-like PEP mutase family enzyme